jgi:hypothetical protein
MIRLPRDCGGCDGARVHRLHPRRYPGRIRHESKRPVDPETIYTNPYWQLTEKTVAVDANGRAHLASVIYRLLWDPPYYQASESCSI